MRLKRELNLERFFSAVRECGGEVWFVSDEKDRLNLKSSLCCFIFTAASRDGVLDLPGTIVCEREEDRELLAGFCEGE